MLQISVDRSCNFIFWQNELMANLFLSNSFSDHHFVPGFFENLSHYNFKISKVDLLCFGALDKVLFEVEIDSFLSNFFFFWVMMLFE